MQRLVLGLGGMLIGGALLTACQESGDAPRAASLPGIASDAVLIGELEVFFDEDGVQQIRERDLRSADVAADLGLAREALTEYSLASIVGRGVNPPDTAELVTCRPTTSPTCDTPYGAGTWMSIPAVAGVSPEGLTSDPGICGPMAAGRSASCMAYDMEVRSFRGEDVSNVTLEFLNFVERTSPTTTVPLDARPYGGTPGSLGLASPGTVFRHGTLEPAPTPVNLTAPPFQSGLRRVRFSFPAGFTNFLSVSYVVRIWGTVGTRHAPHQISVSDQGDPTPDEASVGCITSDGDYTVFASRTPLLAAVSGTTSQIYRQRRRTGAIELISRSASGIPGDADSTHPCMTPDGAWVVYESEATNLVASDTNGATDVFTREIGAAVTTLVSAGASDCGRGGGSNRGQISDDGAVVAFASTCSSLCGGRSRETGCFAGRRQVFRWIRSGSTLEGVSVRTGTSGTIGSATRWGGAGAPLSAGTHNSHVGGINFDGSRVAFSSTASGAGFLGPDAVDTATRDVFVRHVATSETTRISNDRGGAVGSRNIRIASNGMWVAFETASSTMLDGDDNGSVDVLRCPSTGAPCAIVSSPDGTNTVTADGDSGRPFLSADGAYIGFESAATNLVTGDTNGAVDVFVRDFSGTGLSVRVQSVNGAGSFGEGDSTNVRLSADGAYVLFQSVAENLQEDTAGRFDEDGTGTDVFVIRR